MKLSEMVERVGGIDLFCAATGTERAFISNTPDEEAVVSGHEVYFKRTGRTVPVGDKSGIISVYRGTSCICWLMNSIGAVAKPFMLLNPQQPDSFHPTFSDALSAIPE